MYENWESDADQEAADMLDSWELTQSQLAEDESWAVQAYARDYSLE